MLRHNTAQTAAVAQVQFQRWAEETARRFGYWVNFTGVGDAPKHLAEFDVGYASQFALFTRRPGAADDATSSALTAEPAATDGPGAWALQRESTVNFRGR